MSFSILVRLILKRPFVSVISGGPLTGVASEPTSGTEPDGPIMLKSRVIADLARNNMPACRLMVPKGWRVEGGVNAVPPACSMIPYLSDVTVRAPDGRGVRC